MAISDDSRVRDALADGRLPVIFMHQPVRYRIVPGERLAEWEETFRRHVGLDPAPLAYRARDGENGDGDGNGNGDGKVAASATEAYCGEGKCLDACDSI